MTNKPLREVTDTETIKVRETCPPLLASSWKTTNRFIAGISRPFQRNFLLPEIFTSWKGAPEHTIKPHCRRAARVSQCLGHETCHPLVVASEKTQTDRNFCPQNDWKVCFIWCLLFCLSVGWLTGKVAFVQLADLLNIEVITLKSRPHPLHNALPALYLSAPSRLVCRLVQHRWDRRTDGRRGFMGNNRMFSLSVLSVWIILT